MIAKGNYQHELLNNCGGFVKYTGSGLQLIHYNGRDKVDLFVRGYEGYVVLCVTNIYKGSGKQHATFGRQWQCVARKADPSVFLD